MRKSVLTVIICTFFILAAYGSDKPAYRIYTGKGKSTGYKNLVREASSANLVFFGELHDNSLCHWLELQLAKDLYTAKGTYFVMGAEMFETDNQLLLNEYVTRKLIRKKDFEAEAKLWPNYKTDYAPLVDFARDNNIKFVATNIPRRFAALVNLEGFDGLDSILANERGLMPSLPIPYDSSLNCYKNITQATQGMAHMGMNLAEAQAMKDATMAWFMLRNTQADSGLFLHFNGSYHSENYEGMVWMAKQYLKRGNFSPKFLTIATVEQNDLDELEKNNEGKADFIIVIPSDMTKTFRTDLPLMSVPGAASAEKQSPENKPKPKPKPKEEEDQTDDDDD